MMGAGLKCITCLRTWTIVVLICANVLLALLFVAVLLGGSITAEMGKYVTERHLYAPPIAGLLVSLGPFLWEGIKWLIKLHLPSTKKREKLFRAAVDRIRKLARPWQLATTLIVLLVVLAGMQIWAVDHVCSPDPKTGPYGSEGIALSIDERLMYLPDGRNSVAVFAALPAMPRKEGRDPTLNELVANSLNKVGPVYRQISTIQVGNSPQGFARTPDGRHLYVVNGDSGTVSVIDLRTNTVINTLKVGDSPRWIVSSPKGDRIYVSNVYSNRTEPWHGSISIIDARQQALAKDEIKGVNCPEGLALSADGDRLYLASQCGKGQDPLFVIGTSNFQRLAEIPGLAVGNAVALSKDGRKAYVTRANFAWHDPVTGKTGAPLSIVDTGTNSIIKTIILQISGAGLAVTPDGKYALVSNGYQLSVIDAQTDELVNNLSLRGYGNAITVRSDGMVIVSVSDIRRFVAFPLKRALSRWPCASI